MQKFLHLWYASSVHLMLLYIEGSFTQKEFREGARGREATFLTNGQD